MIAVQDLSHRIAGSLILDQITATLPEGKVTALIGPNGAGKSTLLNLVARQDPVQTGRITLDGQDIRQMAPGDLALRMAVVAQNVGVASRLRIRHLVGFGRWPHVRGRPGPQDIEKVDEALAQFDLTELAHRFVDEVSGGQRQRAFVAMAYAQDTDWLLLDEPLNNLDIRHARNLMAELRALSREHGKSVVIVLHDLNYAASWADHVVAIKSGRVAFQGEVENAMSSSALSTLYETPVDVSWSAGRPFIRHHD